MKVALDGSPLAVSTGGIRRYTEQLHQALTLEFPADSCEIMAAQGGRWWSIGLPRALRRNGFSLFHGTDFAVPYFPGTPSVMTIHDLSPWMSSLSQETSARVRRRTPWLLRLGLASQVITPTQAVRREVISRFSLAPACVHAIPHGVDPQFRPTRAEPPAPYLFTVATHGKRKNLDTAIAAAQLAGLELWIAGRGAHPDARGVRKLGAVPDARLPALYSGAAAFLFPSTYEGFGLPLLEAMACGCPVVASTDAALQEVSGGAALHCDPHDPRPWLEAILKIQSNRAGFAARGLARAAEFTWAQTARQTRAVYEEAICRFARR